MSFAVSYELDGRHLIEPAGDTFDDAINYTAALAVDGALIFELRESDGTSIELDIVDDWMYRKLDAANQMDAKRRGNPRARCH